MKNIGTIRKIVKEQLKVHEAKMGDRISNNLQNKNGRPDKISKEMTKLTKSFDFTKDQLEGEINNIKENFKHLETSTEGIKDNLQDPNDVFSE